MFLVSTIGSAVAAPLLALVGHLPFGSDLVQTAVAMAVIGIPAAGFMMLPFAILSDVVDYDEQLTGQRREAIFFGMQGVAQKLMLGAGALTFGQLSATGGEVTEVGLRRVLIAAALGSVAAFVVFLLYPLRERDGKVCLARRKTDAC